ncbi:protein phosphatase 1 regulatory subunit 3C-B [Parambassis ranga]|uniref:Protein phosphatase 1 regulatory subunit 3C-B-like n=1 Tax=Parambassis ranga TaxID=210632 RepID=A0A6P7JBC5_9TELE|nr:protein phosphatase 1 regulatory subunit 3C-B-like [Parambassis ranga]XP_028273981.1 protein phosphatase 1 regulatory subunit 3C-B-like [Parambassis ranga]
MNCTRVLHAFSHPQPAVIPVDLAMFLSQRQPLYQLLSMSPLTQPTKCPPRTSFYSPHPSLRSSLPSLSLPSTHAPSQPRSCFRRDSCGVNKKRVVFADAKGLALTAVRLFIPEPSSRASTLMMRPSVLKQERHQSPLNKLHKLRLGFPQPTLDFKAFLARLREMHVQLDSCNISEHSLSGKVCASRVSNESSAHIRVTFDSWRSHHDVPCMFFEQRRCGGSDVDVFTFDLSLPKTLDPKERIEFCVSFTPTLGSTPKWDDNRGQNYRICFEMEPKGKTNCYYPTLPKQWPPSWPSKLSTSTLGSTDQAGTLSSRVCSAVFG